MSDGDGIEGDGIPPELEMAFWRIVVLLNIGPIFITVGVGVGVLGGEFAVAASAIGVGVVALALAAYLYKKYSGKYVS